MTEDAVEACQAGRISPEVALARLLLSGRSLEQIELMLPAGSAVANLFNVQRNNLADVARMVAAAGVDHDAPRTTASVAAMFDHAVACAPEASVAAYALNDAAVLARATAELVEWLLARAYARPGCSVLDFGCGIGRVTAALAPHVQSSFGVDISSSMIAEARRRHGSLGNVGFEVTSAEPPILPRGGMDLILAVDSFPYLVQAGVADPYVTALTDGLAAAGTLVILNLSYEGLTADRARIRSWLDRLPLRLEVDGVQPFTLWDGTAFVLRRQGGAQHTRLSPARHTLTPTLSQGEREQKALSLWNRGESLAASDPHQHGGAGEGG